MIGPDPRPEENAVGRRWRPDCDLTIRQVRRVRRLRRKDLGPAAIAERMKVELRDVELAMAAMRGRRAAATNHATLNVRRMTAERINRERLPGEPIWQTVDRLLDELEAQRAGA
jgi:hypothetical protein